MTLFQHASLVLADRVMENGYLLEEEGLIRETGPMDSCPQGDFSVVDCGGLYLSPGFVDLHSHGGGGHDFMDGTLEAMEGAAREHMRHGTTTLLPTTLTSSDEDLYLTIENFKKLRGRREGLPCMPGLHLEGPYFAMEERGAQNPSYLKIPTPAHYESIMERADGGILRWSVAPELEGAMEMGRRLSRQGVLMAVAHTVATLDQVKEAVENGYTLLTHLYSGMSTIVRRDGFRVLGVVESAYLLDELNVEIISDGVHLPPDLLRLILKCKDHSHICLVTDSMRGAGLTGGTSILGSLKEGQQVIIEDGIAKMPDRSCFAGSVATTDRLVRVMVQQAGLPLAEAVGMMTRNPARFSGLESKGSLEPGKDADLVLFDEDIQIRQVYIDGIKTV